MLDDVAILSRHGGRSQSSGSVEGAIHGTVAKLYVRASQSQAASAYGEGVLQLESLSDALPDSRVTRPVRRDCNLAKPWLK